MNCNLGNGKIEFIKDMNTLISNVSVESKENQISRFKSGLKQLMSKYENAIEQFKESVKEYLDDENERYEISKHEDLADELINSIDNVFNGIVQESEQGPTDKIGRTLSTDFTERSQIRQQFLDKYFKYNSSSKLLFQKSFRNSAIRSLFIVEDEDNKYLANSEEEINESIQNFRERLFNDIIEALKLKSNSAVINNFRRTWELDANIAIKNYLDDIFNDESIFPKSLIARLPEINSENLGENNKVLLKGFQAYVALKHFDELMAQTFQKAISIKNFGEYNLNNSDKYSIKTADRVIHQWRDDDVDTDETEELGSLPMLFVSSLQVHDKSGRATDETLEFSNVKVAIGHLMKILDVQSGSDFLGNSFPEAIINDKVTRVIEDEFASLYNGKVKSGQSIDSFNKRYGKLNQGKNEQETVNYLRWILDTYVKGKTFKQVLAAAKRYPEILMPIVFRLTQPVYQIGLDGKKSDIDINQYSSIFSKQSKTEETIRSLYYEIYSPESYSVFSMNIGEKGFNPDNNSIFQHVNTMFLNIENKQQLEYLKDEEKGIITVNLGDKVGNTRLKLFQRALETKYDKLNPLSQTNSDGEEQFQEFSIIDNLEREENNESPSGKSIIIKTKDGKQIVVDSDLTYKVFDENGKSFPITEQNLRHFIPIFNEVLDLDFNEAFINILRTQKGQLKEVLGLVSRMLYNFQVSKHMINTRSSEYDNVIKSYYTLKNANDKYPTVAYSSVQPRIISNFDYKSILSKISKVKDILEGYSEINTVQDGERKQVSTLGLSSLLSKYNEIIENYGKNPESPIKHFSIYGMYEGAELMRDYAEPGNNKQAKKFTEEELVTASFLYDMYGDLMELNEEDGTLVEKGGGILRVMGPVVSDKGNLIKLKYNWDSPIKEKYNALLRPDDPNVKLRLRDLTASDLKTIIKEEFGEYYQNVLNYVQSQYDILNEKHKSAIIWAHPGMGKSWSVENGKYKDQLIDWDVEFNRKRDAWIAEKSNTEIGSEEFNEVKKLYLTDSIRHPENYQDFIEFYTQEWNRVKNKARSEGKILVASPHILLKLFPQDFDKIITMDDETFIQRNVERGGTEQDSIALKQDLNTTLSQIQEQNKIVTDNRYLEEMLEDDSLRSNYIDMAINSLGLNYSKGSKLDYLSSFAEFNEIFGKDAQKVLREAIYLAQQAGEEIEIIDQVHYIAKDGQLQNNPSLIHQLQIFGKLGGGEQYEDFWKRKEDQLFVDFLQTETELQVKEGVNDKKGIAIQTALQKNQGWIKGENIAVAKVSEDDRSLLIATKDDFKNWYPYKSLLNWYGKEIPSNLNIDSPDANLQAIMEAIDQYSVVRKLSEEETFNKIIESKPDKWKSNIKGEYLLQQAFILYSITRRKYNRDIPTERLQEDFNKKVEKEFTKDGKLDKKALAEYINKKETINDIEALMDPMLLGPDGDNSYLNPFIESIEKPQHTIELNPEFVKHNLYDFLLSEEFVLSTTGTHISQPGKSSNITEREAEQFGNAVKRYVAYTASKHREEANALNGITEDINLAIIEDDKDFSFNFVGESGTDKPFDGASFYNILMNYLDNNSLGGDAMGVDKKPFAHYQGIKSGIGFILKTAGFAHTNDRIRNSKFDARLNKQMNDLKWDSPKIQKLINPNWKPGDEIYTPRWWEDYFGNRIDYGEWFAYRQNQDGTWSWYKHRVNGNNIEMIKVLSNGTIQDNQKWIKYPKSINSNYDLWEAFGGAYSGHLQKNSDKTETLVYEHDESSVLRLLKAVNNVGIRKTINGKPIEKVFDQNGVNQYLKKACIHIVATGGAVKYGGANINPKEAYYDDDYHLTHMVIKSYDLGEQLDAEHSAEDGHVSLMTQVVNALGARGYTSQEAMQCYVALSNMAEYITGDILKSMETDDPELIDKAMEKSIYKTLLQASDNDGDMLNALAASLLNGEDPSSKNISEIAKNFPISHPAVFNKILSSLASQLEKGIKLKFEGGMFVLNPSNRRMTVINGHLSGYYDTRRKIYNGKDSQGNERYIDELLDLENKSQDNPITSIADIKLGYNYRDSETDELYIINKPTDIYAIGELINQGHTFYETFIDNDNQPLGRDLTTYQLSFSDIEGNRYNSWELDSVKMLQYLQFDKKGNEIGFKIPSRKTEDDIIAFQTKLQANWDTLTDLQKAFNIFKNKQLQQINPRKGGVNYDLLSLLRVDQQEELEYLSLPEEVQQFGVKNYLTRRFQEELNAISSGIETEVQVNGRKIKVDKTKTEITPFGLILPPIYKTQFGLREQDNLSNIEKDKMFFVRRQLQNWKTKIANQNTYDLELKTLNGEHIYLARLTNDFIPNNRIQQEVQLEFPTNFEWDGEVLYRITPLGKRLYSVPYTTDETGNVIPDIRVFKDKATGTEIIYSRNLTHFLDEFNYTGIVFSQRIPFTKEDYEDDYEQALLTYKRDLLRQINSSNNKSAVRKINSLIRRGSDIVNNNVSEDLRNDSYDIDYLARVAPKTLISLMDGDYDFMNKNIQQLEEDLQHSELTVEDLLSRNKFFTGLINSGIEVHTSFLESLEAIVSRTPAQSQQSFMAMRIEAFGLENTNSAYVSRDQLWLQGSDYDIDKISLLGLKFNHGKLVVWSPFFSLKSTAAFLASKKLPFPTNRELSMLPIGENSKIPYDVLRNDLTVILPEDSESGEMSITTPQGTKLTIKQVVNPFENEDSVEITAEGWENASKLEQYILMRRAKEALSQFNGKIYLTNFNIPYTSRLAIGLQENGHLTDNIDKELDFEEFNQAILGDYLKYNGIRQIQENIIEYAPNLGVLIQTYNDLGYIPENQNNIFIKTLIDIHNTSIQNKSLMDALYNFISIKVKDISADPANRIQGQSPIDPEMDKVKDLINDSETYPENQKLAGFIKKFDRGSMYSKIKMLTLTLGGKEGVGIEASSLKNFELSSQYNYETLDKGTEQDQEDLLFNIRINGKTYEILANSRARNIDTVKSRRVREVLKKVNQHQDTYLTKSGLLSLSTDNAKDPKLPQLNCGPKMMSLYDAGVMLGMSVNELAHLILTDTGILINKIAQSNIFTGKQEQNRIIDVIRYLQRAPQINLTDSQLSVLQPLFEKLGILKYKIDPTTKQKEYEKLNKTKLGSILLNKSLRGQLKEVFRFLQNPSEDYSLLEFKKNRVVNNIISSLYGSKEYRGFSNRAERYFNELESLDKRSEEQEKTYQDLLDKKNKKAQILGEIKLWEDYKNGIIPNQSIKIRVGNEEREVGRQINDLENTINNYTKDDFKSELKRIQGNIFSGRQYLGAIKDIYKWLNYQDIIEETVEDEEGQKHRVLYQLLKLAEIAEEQSTLRPLMKLNQGLENKVEDSIKFYTDFSKIISDRIEVLGKERALKRGNTSELLAKLKQMNDDLRTSGVINSKEDYYVDLHTFLYNPEYNKLVKDIYGNIKCTTNIFKVVDNIPNYKKYLRLADAYATISYKKSKHYKILKYIEDTVIPEFGVRKTKWLEQMRKNATSYINRQKNKEFLLSQNIVLKIPSFKIENGKLIYLSNKPETIQLGLNKENDLKFKQYVEFILFPELKKKYPSNAFLSYLGYRVFDFNDDHNSSINLSKIKTNNMDNPSDLAQFNLAKLDMLELNKEDIKKLFYYNLIAYNNQSGQSSLTIMFDDIIRNNSIDTVVDYNKFITEWDKQPISTLNMIETMKAIAPVLKLYEVNSGLRIRYFYVQNPEDKKTYLCYKLANQNNSYNEDDNPDGFNNYGLDESGEKTVKSFRKSIEDAGYGIFSLPKQETKGKEVQLLDFGNKYKYRISPSDNFEQVQIQDGDNWWSAKDILEIAQSKGISFKDSGEVVKNLMELFGGKAKNIKSKLKDIQYKLDVILHDESVSKC